MVTNGGIFIQGCQVGGRACLQEILPSSKLTWLLRWNITVVFVLGKYIAWFSWLLWTIVILVSGYVIWIFYDCRLVNMLRCPLCPLCPLPFLMIFLGWFEALPYSNIVCIRDGIKYNRDSNKISRFMIQDVGFLMDLKICEKLGWCHFHMWRIKVPPNWIYILNYSSTIWFLLIYSIILSDLFGHSMSFFLLWSHVVFVQRILQGGFPTTYYKLSYNPQKNDLMNG